MCAALILPGLHNADRFDYALAGWKALSGNGTVGFDNAVYKSEPETADRNLAPGTFMREHQAFPKKTDLPSTLQLYS